MQNSSLYNLSLVTEPPQLMAEHHSPFKLPFFGWLMWVTGTVPIAPCPSIRHIDAIKIHDPGNRRAANRRSLDALARAMAN